MKNLNRWVYAIIGVITLLLAGLVYAWSVMSKSIGASRPDWTAAQLSMTFTMQKKSVRRSTLFFQEFYF